MVAPVIIAAAITAAGAAASSAASASAQSKAAKDANATTLEAQRGRSGPWEPAWPYLENITDQSNALLNREGGFTPYGGEFYSGINDTQELGLGMTRYAANRMQGQVVDPALGAYQQMLADPMDVQNTPGLQQLQQAFARETGQNLSDYILPQMQASGAGYGHRGSSRMDLARGLAGSRAADSIADNNASMLNNAYNQRLQQQSYALGQAGNMGALTGQPGQMMYGAGQAYQDDENQRLNADYQKWQAQNFGELEYLQQHANIGTALGNQGDVRRGLPGDGYNPGGSMTLAGAGLQNATYDDQIFSRDQIAQAQAGNGGFYGSINAGGFGGQTPFNQQQQRLY